MHARQAKTEANHAETMAAVKASQERMKSLMDVSLEMMEACLEKTEANQEKVETKMKACVEQEHKRTNMGTSNWLWDVEPTENVDQGQCCMQNP
jgi:hypothetical protein